MIHFVTYHMKQSKSRKQILESAQNGLETKPLMLVRHLN